MIVFDGQNGMSGRFSTSIIVFSYGSVGVPKLAKEVIWLRPPKNIKFNVNGSSMGNRVSEWIVGFARSCRVASDVFNKLLAISEDLDMAWCEGYMVVIVELYSVTLGYHLFHCIYKYLDRA
jgi:hypothetical protein